METRGTPVIKGLCYNAAGNCCMTCSVDADYDADKILRIRPFRYKDEDIKRPWTLDAKGVTYDPGMKTSMSPFSLVYKKRIYSKNRILYPLKRVDWDPKGERNPQTRGTSEYERISWDEALDIIVDEIERVVKTYGMPAILAQGDGHGETKIVHATHAAPGLLLDLVDDGNFTFQVRNPDSWEGWYWGAKHMWGMDPFGYTSQSGNLVKDIAQNSDALLQWGCDPETTPLGILQNVACTLEYFFSDCGVKQIMVAPDANYANVVHADKWIPVLPNTDAALQLAIAYVWLTEGTYEKEYLKTHSVGFENWAYYVLGGEDGIPKTPKWAEKKCHVPSYTIKALARYWAKHNVSIGHVMGGSMIRSCFSTEPARLEVCLLGMQGLGKPGRHQFLFGAWALFGKASSNPLPPGEETPVLSSAYRATPNWRFSDNQIPKTMVPQAIVNPPVTWYSHIRAGMPREDQFTGPFTYPAEGYPRVHMLWCDNPCWSTCWNGGNEYHEAMRDESIEFILVQHPWMENDTVFADIILPINTKLEEGDDIYADGDTGKYNIVYLEDQIINSRGESVSDTDAVRMVAERMDERGGMFEGILERYTQGNTNDDWCRIGFEENTLGPTKMTYEEFKEKKYYVVPTVENWEDLPTGMYGFCNDPDNNKLLTPTGKLEYYSSALAEKFPDDMERSPIARWVEESDEHKERITSDRAVDYPFLLVSNHPRWRVHAQHDDVTWFREIETCKIKGPDGYGYEPIWVNPKDAGKLGIKHHDILKMYNERGAVMGAAYITERIMEGVISQDHGARVDALEIGFGKGIDRGGANNLIAPSAITSKNSPGMVTSGFLVNIEKVDVFELAKKYPDAFNRDYDPDCGIVETSRVRKEA